MAESVLNITSTTAAECATWVVRVLDPHLEEYTFSARGERIAACHFHCVLVGDTPNEYIQGGVSFDFRNRQRPRDAMRQFEPGSVWCIQRPVMDSRAKAEFNGAPIKETLLLALPTRLQRVAAADARAELPSRFILPSLTLSDIMGLRKTRAVDFAAVVESVTEARTVQKKEGGITDVLDVVFIDGSTTKKGNLAQCTAAMWGEAGRLFTGQGGQKAVFRNCMAKLSDGKIKVEGNGKHVRVLWSLADQLQHLPDLADVAERPRESVTSAGIAPPISLDGPALLTCAALLAGLKDQAVGIEIDRVFQVNQVSLEAPTDTIRTQDDARLFVKSATLRDWSGHAIVSVVERAVPALFNCADEEEVMRKHTAGELKPNVQEVNVRGVKRVSNGEVRILVGGIQPSDLKQSPTRVAIQLPAFLGLCEGEHGGVVVAPLRSIVFCPLAGLAVRTEDGETVGVHRAIVLVEGTEASTLDPLPNAQVESFVIRSNNVKCLLEEAGEDAGVANLIGYATRASLLQYTVGEDTVRAHISAARSAQGASGKKRAYPDDRPPPEDPRKGR